MKVLLVLFASAFFINVNAQKMKEYKIEIAVKASKEKVWEVITNFENYPSWNSVLKMESNNNLIVGNKFKVTITQPNGKSSNFKAKAVSKNDFKSFSATQVVMLNWFFKATHSFIIEEVDEQNVVFIQKWELKGIIASLFRKKIFKELEIFKKMNRELKELVEQ
ncbi:MAG: SRPBCC domain-containing protein [Allomuricauda sp.]|jgi:hypothetical protein|uniref:SRPBCC domain-containing protein n=1 Tax=Yeosuana marina TaxID=1565536 RepID=UPI0030D7407D|tara:strand:- start:1347 stop:1838 length:492 start_codon:yes stop_codon:yes gene_type:complete